MVARMTIDLDLSGDEAVHEALREAIDDANGGDVIGNRNVPIIEVLRQYALSQVISNCEYDHIPVDVVGSGIIVIIEP